MTDAEIVTNFSSVIEKVERGIDVIVDRNDRPVAVIRSPAPAGRPLDECILLSTRYEQASPRPPSADPDFERDVRAAVESHHDHSDSSGWD